MLTKRCIGEAAWVTRSLLPDRHTALLVIDQFTSPFLNYLKRIIQHVPRKILPRCLSAACSRCEFNLGGTEKESFLLDPDLEI